MAETSSLLEEKKPFLENNGTILKENTTILEEDNSNGGSVEVVKIDCPECDPPVDYCAIQPQKCESADLRGFDWSFVLTFFAAFVFLGAFIRERQV